MNHNDSKNAIANKDEVRGHKVHLAQEQLRHHQEEINAVNWSNDLQMRQYFSKTFQPLKELKLRRASLHV